VASRCPWRLPLTAVITMAVDAGATCSIAITGVDGKPASDRTFPMIDFAVSTGTPPPSRHQQECGNALPQLELRAHPIDPNLTEELEVLNPTDA